MTSVVTRKHFSFFSTSLSTQLVISAILTAALLLMTPAMLTTKVFAQLIPYNDTFSEATVISGNAAGSSPFRESFSLRGATSGESFEGIPDPACRGLSGFPSVWYKFTAPAPIRMQATTDGSLTPTILSINEFPENRPLEQIACEHNMGGGEDPKIVFDTVAHQTYYFMIAGDEHSAEHVTFTLGSHALISTDTTPPDLSVPDDITVEATGPDGAQVLFYPSAYDAVDGSASVRAINPDGSPAEDPVLVQDEIGANLIISCDPTWGSIFPLGETVVTCIAEDSVGNAAQGSFTVTVQDTTSPVVEITKAVDRRSGTEIPDGGTTPIPYVQITFEATDAIGIDNTECSLDGQAPTSCESPVTYDKLSRGSHEVTVRATDAAGNTGEDEFSWTVGNSTPTRGQPSAAAPTSERTTTPPTATEEEQAEEEDEETTSSPALEEPATENEDVEGENDNVIEPDTDTGGAGAAEEEIRQ